MLRAQEEGGSDGGKSNGSDRLKEIERVMMLLLLLYLSSAASALATPDSAFFLRICYVWTHNIVLVEE